MAEQGGLREIADILAQLAFVQAALDGLRINNGFARKVEQHGAGFDQAQCCVIDQVGGRVHRRNVQRDVVGPGQQGLQVFHAGDFV